MPSASFSTRQRRRRLIARHHLGRTAAGVVEATRGADRVGLVGIRRGGVVLAERLAEAIGEARGGEPPPVGTVDIARRRAPDKATLPMSFRCTKPAGAATFKFMHDEDFTP